MPNIFLPLTSDTLSFRSTAGAAFAQLAYICLEARNKILRASVLPAWTGSCPLKLGELCQFPPRITIHPLLATSRVRLLLILPIRAIHRHKVTLEIMQLLGLSQIISLRITIRPTPRIPSQMGTLADFPTECSQVIPTLTRIRKLLAMQSQRGISRYTANRAPLLLLTALIAHKKVE